MRRRQSLDIDYVDKVVKPWRLPAGMWRKDSLKYEGEHGVLFRDQRDSKCFAATMCYLHGRGKLVRDFFRSRINQSSNRTGKHDN